MERVPNLSDLPSLAASDGARYLVVRPGGFQVRTFGVKDGKLPWEPRPDAGDRFVGWGGAFHAIRAEGATVTVTQLTDAGAGAKLVLDVPESAEYRYRVIDDHLFVLAGRKNDFDIVVVAPGGEVVGRGNKATAFTTSDYWIGPGLPDGGAFVEYLQTWIDGTGEHLSLHYHAVDRHGTAASVRPIPVIGGAWPGPLPGPDPLVVIGYDSFDGRYSLLANCE